MIKNYGNSSVLSHPKSRITSFEYSLLNLGMTKVYKNMEFLEFQAEIRRIESLLHDFLKNGDYDHTIHREDPRTRQDVLWIYIAYFATCSMKL